MKTRYSKKFEGNLTPSRAVLEHCREVGESVHYDDGVALLQYRGTHTEYGLGLEYCESLDPLDRALGADLLGQLGWGDQTFLEESVHALIPMLKDTDARVVFSAAFALGHRSDPQAIPHLLEIAKHENSDVRHGVVFGLLGHEDLDAIQALIYFTKDTDAEVRNWALFGLGMQIETDTSEIRTALFEGLQESDVEARGEAMVGLAVRGDARVVDAILNEWDSEEMISQLSIEAAGAIGDPRLLPDLQGFLEKMELDDDSVFRDYLVDAIASCQIKTK